MMNFIDSGDMATKSLASFGDDALRRVTALLDDRNTPDTIRPSAYRVLQQMTEKKNLQNFLDPEASRAILKARLLQSLSEPNMFCRIEGVNGLAQLGDADVIPVLETVAASDPLFDPRPEANGRLLVREAAQKALQKLKSH